MNARAIPDKELCAAIDLGSNSFRLLVAETDGTTITPLHKDLETVRLAEGLQPTKKLTDRAIDRSLAALKRFSKTLTQFAPQKIRVCGTAALRVATNRDDFIGKAEQIVNCKIEIIQGEEEASLSLSGVLSAVTFNRHAPNMVIDVGGGSTEIIVTESSKSTKRNALIPRNLCSASFPVGAVSMTEQFLTNFANESEGLSRLNNYLEKVFLNSNENFKTEICCNPITAWHKNKGQQKSIIASGGTATSLAALDLNLTEYQAELVQNHCISQESLEQTLDKLLTLSLVERNKIASMKNGRGDIIIAGIQIHKTILKLSEASQMLISDAGFLEGILLSL